MLKLFFTPGTCALASRIALEDAGADYEVARVDFSKNEQRGPDYLKVNPKGRVPALVTDQGVLTETPAILLYIAQMFPDARLAPLDDPFALAKMQGFNSYICSSVHVNHAHGRRGARWANEQSSFDDMKAKVPATMAAAMQLIEDQFLEGPWVMGNAYTVADPYLHTIERWLKGDGVDIANYPKISAHFSRMSERDSVKRATADEH
ncbi:glutathione S-transferase family protein [Rhizobium sp. TH2]|uniref:glutathione S-transferase family protein n=1 Tax=Rhizobium sp. TH2 TaxID=2775403 RepID=UPI002157B97F|nr:glutathione S-transferase family protein [Rhizobium sp. TH2]UVC09492.1 glutathione S-transferase family protein [Rhizobium sp. TH2]